MTEPIHKGKDLPPVWVIRAASGGDSEAVERVLRHYDDYMSRLCTRTLYDNGRRAPAIRMRSSARQRSKIRSTPVRLFHRAIRALQISCWILFRFTAKSGGACPCTTARPL